MYEHDTLAAENNQLQPS